MHCVHKNIKPVVFDYSIKSCEQITIKFLGLHEVSRSPPKFFTPIFVNIFVHQLWTLLWNWSCSDSWPYYPDHWPLDL